MYSNLFGGNRHIIYAAFVLQILYCLNILSFLSLLLSILSFFLLLYIYWLTLLDSSKELGTLHSYYTNNIIVDRILVLLYSPLTFEITEEAKNASTTPEKIEKSVLCRNLEYNSSPLIAAIKNMFIQVRNL